MVWRESAAGAAASTASLEYQLYDYGSLAPRPRRRPRYWATISARLRDGHACASMKRLVLDPNTGMLVQEALGMFYGHGTEARWTCMLDGRERLHRLSAAAVRRQWELPQH
jgi:hypothetical protein